MRFSLLFAFVIAGCGGSSGVNITKTVGANGGSVSQPDGTSVSIPPGALSSDANITISTVNVPAPPGTVIVGQAYDFGPEGTTFKAAVTITLPFDMAKLPAGRTASDVLIYTAPKGSTQYTTVATTLGSSQVTTQTNHFTVYLPAAPLAETAIDFASKPLDFGSSSGCSPQCTTGTSTCSCTETCNGHTYTMSCGGSSSTSCGCEIDQVTQPTSIIGGPCTDGAGLESTFIAQCGPKT